MNPTVAVFVRTPGLSPVRTRLARDVGEAAALEFYELSRACVAEAIREAALPAYWAVAERAGLADPVWATPGFGRIGQGEGTWGEGTWGERLDRVYRAVLARAGAAILVGARTPTLTPGHLRAAAAELARGADFVLGPARDGGFYLFGGKRAVPPVVWKGVPYGSAETASRLRERLDPISPVRLLPALAGVDEGRDLGPLRAELIALPEPVSAQKRLLSWLESRIPS